MPRGRVCIGHLSHTSATSRVAPRASALLDAVDDVAAHSQDGETRRLWTIALNSVLVTIGLRCVKVKRLVNAVLDAYQPVGLRRRRVSGSGLRFAYEENLMPEKYKGFTFEASAVAVAPREFRGAALIFKDGSIVWREANATSFPTEAEARTEAEIIAPNVID